MIRLEGVSVHWSRFCLCVRPPGGHSLSRRCNPTPTAKPHPIQPLVSRRKSQTLTLTLRTICRVAIEICIDTKNLPVGTKVRRASELTFGGAADYSKGQHSDSHIVWILSDYWTGK